MFTCTEPPAIDLGTPAREVQSPQSVPPSPYTHCSDLKALSFKGCEDGVI